MFQYSSQLFDDFLHLESEIQDSAAQDAAQDGPRIAQGHTLEAKRAHFEATKKQKGSQSASKSRF